MTVSLQYWWMFPVSTLVATTAMCFGVGGAVFFSPIFIIVFPWTGVTLLTPANAFGAALLTELAGFSSGLIAYVMRGLIDWKSGAMLIAMGVPMTIMGTMIKKRLGKHAAWALIAAFSIVCFMLSMFVFSHAIESRRMSKRAKHSHRDGDDDGDDTDSLHAALLDETEGDDTANSDGAGGLVGPSHPASARTLSASAPQRRSAGLEWSRGEPGRSLSVDARPTAKQSFWHREVYDKKEAKLLVYKVCRPVQGMIAVGLASGLTGMVSAGVGESSVSVLSGSCKFPLDVAAATSVFVTMVVVFVAAGTQIILEGVSSVPWDLLMFSVPGVLLGGQIGARVSTWLRSKLSRHATQAIVASLFLFLAVVMALEAMHFKKII